MWIESKTLKTYACLAVANKDGYSTDLLHAWGSAIVAGKSLSRNPYASSKLKGKANNILPEQAIMKSRGASTWLSKAIREYLPDEEKSKLSAVSLRTGGITEMGVGNLGFYPSHARSGHTIGTNQEKYLDRDNIESSLAAAKCLAGWTDYNAPVYSPSLGCLNVPAEVMNTFLNMLWW